MSLAALLWARPASAQAVWYVDADATGSASGTSWVDAFPDLQLALAAATSGDEIWVAEGLYRPTSGSDRTISFDLPSSVALYGGFYGTETDRDERDWTLHETILSGDVGVSGDSLDNSLHVVRATDATSGTTLDGIIIQHGYADGTASPDFLGGGLYVLRGALTLRNSTIRYNATRRNGTPDGGGGVYAESADLLVEDVSFEQNVAQDYGASLYVVGGSAHVARVVARGDSALTGSSFYVAGGSIDMSTCSISEAYSRGGGAVHLNMASGTMRDCVIEDNVGVGLIVIGGNSRFVRLTVRGNLLQGGDGGGAIVNDFSSVVFEDALFENNTADDGAAIEVRAGSSALFLRSTFRDNLALSAGSVSLRLSSGVFLGCRFEHNLGVGTAGLNALNSDVTVLQSAFIGNQSTFAAPTGGGLLVTGGAFSGKPTLIASSLFAGNSADGGGAVAAFGISPGEALIVNTTFAGNEGRTEGGAIYAQDAGGLQIQNSILWGNTAPDGPEVHVANGAPPMIAQSIVSGGYPSGMMILDEDPQFVRTPDPGPDGQWGTEDDDYGDLRLSEGSPAVDYGLAQYLPPDTWDLDGDGDTTEPLPVDVIGNTRQIGPPDLGAYEGAIRVGNEPDGLPGPGDMRLRVWPNPSGGEIQIEIMNAPSQDGGEVTVTDVLGRVVLRSELTRLRTVMDVSGLAPGVYVVRVGEQSNTITVRQ